MNCFLDIFLRSVSVKNALNNNFKAKLGKMIQMGFLISVFIVANNVIIFFIVLCADTFL